MVFDSRGSDEGRFRRPRVWPVAGVDVFLAASAALVGALATAALHRNARFIPSARLATAGLVVIAAAATAASGAQPTGQTTVDLGWRVALGVATVLVARRSRPWGWLVAAAIVAAAATGVGVALGFGALGLGVGAVRRGAAQPIIGAAVGALLAPGVLHLGWPRPFGWSAAVAGLALAALAAAAGRPGRRGTVVVAIGAVAWLGLAVAPVVALGLHRQDLVDGIDAGKAGLTAVRAGDTDVAAERFQVAADSISKARRPLESWWARPALAVPGLAQQLRTARAVLASADEVARSGARTARTANPDRLQPTDGRIDLAELATFAAPLHDLTSSLVSARRTLGRTSTSWTVAPLRDRVAELAHRLDGATADARRAGQAVEVLPRLLGAGGQRRYLLAVMTPAELRSAGGLMGNWGILTATNGALSLERFGRVAELFDARPFHLHVNDEFDARYLDLYHLTTAPQNLTASPDLPTDAIAMAQVLDQAGVGHIDGVIALDPYAMAALLRLTGPLAVEGWPEPFSEANAARVLLFDQYAHPDDPNRPELLAQASRTLFDRLTHGALPSSGAIVDAMGPQVDGRHLQFASFDPALRPFLRDVGLERPLRAPAVDAVHVTTTSGSSTKLAWYLRRSIRYDLRVDARTGESRATVTVTLRNTAPTSGLTSSYYHDTELHLAVGEDIQLTSLLTPLEATTVTIDGVAVDHLTGIEQGLNAYEGFAHLAAGGSATVVFTLRGELPIQRGRYQLELHRQPTVAPDDLTVVVNGRTLFHGPQDRDLVLRSRLR
ncbi:MAG: hypothetical protein JWN67_458 [Actinomycetia bacterium]|nr:hypothetical protein [Actinomycetes bacterium]